MKSYTPEQLGIISQPLDSNEVGQAMIAHRAFLTAMIIGERMQLPSRYMAIARPEAVYTLPNKEAAPPQFYAERGEQ